MTRRPRPLPPEAEADVAEAARLHRKITRRYAGLEPDLKARRLAIGRARAKGATLQVIAERLGVSRTAIANLEEHDRGRADD